VPEIIRVGVVDDHPGVRAAIIRVLKAAEDILVVGEGADGAGAIALARAQKPDLLLLDVELPDIRGDVVMTMIHEKQPEVKVLPVSTYSDREHVRAMVDNGADGYITKDEAPAMLLRAIRSIVTGRKWISPKASRSTQQNAMDEPSLTGREAKILDLLRLDRSEAEIAASLELDEKQVSKYIKFLMNKFGARSLRELKSKERARGSRTRPGQQ
jgi:DNA-binding NarL/FixJ family response regulator